jgi:hypothetical protein
MQMGNDHHCHCEEPPHKGGDVAISRYNQTTYKAEMLGVLPHICHLLQLFYQLTFYQGIATSASPPRNDTVI